MPMIFVLQRKTFAEALLSRTWVTFIGGPRNTYMQNDTPGAKDLLWKISRCKLKPYELFSLRRTPPQTKLGHFGSKVLEAD